MKLNRNHWFMAISTVALLIVLIIQVNWILETARIREELFNEKAKMVLSKTAEALSDDHQACTNLQSCTNRAEKKKIDSLFNYYLKFYNIQIKYHFEVRSRKPHTAATEGFDNMCKGGQSGCFETCVGEKSCPYRLDLKLEFPDKQAFILAEMGPMFITSVILILVVLFMSWRTVVSLMKEKEISEHTTDFLNNMTHEFKTPLTNISLAGRMLVRETNIRQEEKIRHYSGIILDENEKLRLQVEQVLSMTALERGEIPLKKSELDFHQLIHHALKCISLQVENRHGTLQLDLQANSYMIIGDPTHLNNALCNLVDNAIKYTPGTPVIRIATTNSGSRLSVTISDNGPGIEKRYQKRIFDTFFRIPTGDLHDVKGFGIGLSYVKRIITLHDGTISLQSEKGKGTTFIITLPYV